MEQLDTRKIATRYAKALFEASNEAGEQESIQSAIDTWVSVFTEVPDLAAFFANPIIPMAEKKALLTEQFSEKTPDLLLKIVDLLFENDRIGLLGDVLTVYQELSRAALGIARAEVTVPVSIPATLETKLVASLKKAFGYKQVELTTTVDPDIIAGAIVRIGDKIIDGSYRGKLDMLKRQVG